MIVAFSQGIYLPLTVLTIGCCAVFAHRLGVPMIRRQTPLAGNYLAVSVIGFTFVLGYETPLYWLVRNVPNAAWLSEAPAVFVFPKVVALAASVFAAAGLSHALTGKGRLGWFVVGAAVLWAAGGAASMIVRALHL